MLDEFFVFMQEIGMLAALEEMKLPGVRRVMVPTVQFVLLYLLKVLFGGQSMNELPRVLFTKQQTCRILCTVKKGTPPA